MQKRFVNFKYSLKSAFAASFSWEIKRHFGVNYVANFHGTDTFEPPKVRIEFPNKEKELYWREWGVIMGKMRILKCLKPLKGLSSDPSHKMRITLEPFKSYTTITDGVYSTPIALIKNLVQSTFKNQSLCQSQQPQFVKRYRNTERNKNVLAPAHLVFEIFRQIRIFQ